MQMCEDAKVRAEERKERAEERREFQQMMLTLTAEIMGNETRKRRRSRCERLSSDKESDEDVHTHVRPRS